jgi:hypothetical protein
MKTRITALVLLLAALFAVLPPSAFADYSDDDVLNKLPVLTPDLMKQVPFLAHIEDNGLPLFVQLHNPFRDKTIQGVVLNITGKDTATGKDVNIDVFVRLLAGPLNLGINSHGLFMGDVLSKPESNTVITLKEIHYSQAGSSPAAKSKAAKHAASN